MTKLIATKAFGYGGVQLEAGQEFEASHPHAKALIALQKASMAGDEPAPTGKKAKKEKEADEPKQDDADAAKRKYHRRDMKAD